MPIKYEYGVYDESNNLIFKGCGNELEEEFDISRSLIGHCVYRGVKLRRKYTIKKLGIYKKTAEEIRIAKKLSEEELFMQYILKHLKEHGNVYCNNNPEKYLDDLKKIGYDCEIKTYFSAKQEDFVLDGSSFRNRPKKKQYEKDYILQIKR